MYEINETHDPNLKSWVESANDPNTDFPIQNLPFCSFRNRSTEMAIQIGVRLGGFVIALDELPIPADFNSIYGPWAANFTVEAFKDAAKLVREFLVEVFREDADQEKVAIAERSLLPVSDLT